MGQEAPHENGSAPAPAPKAESNGHEQVGGYRLLRELQSDSLGSVFEAEHPKLHRRVAVRTIGTGVARDVSFSRRFLLELRSYTALEHEAIPRLYELAYDGEKPYLVTELIPGHTLDHMLGDGQRYEPAGIISLLRPIAGALDYAHSRATVHRDVKPANILLADDGRTLLTGFGLGTVASFNTGPGTGGPVAPDYVAPERLVGREVDGRADVYSMAAVIFEATSGQRPFSSKSWIETLSRRLYEPPPNVREVVPDLSVPFAEVLQEAMDRDPNRRPSTAGELLDRLEASLSPRREPRKAARKETRKEAPTAAGNETGEARPWPAAIGGGGIGLSAALVAVIGVAELAWFLEGSGLTLAMRSLNRLLGLH